MAMQVMERVLTKATGEDLNDYADKTLWGPIGAQYKPYYQSDSIVTPLVDALPSENEDPLTYGGVNAACRDLARFGQLWLQHGNWSTSERIFNEEFFVRGITEAAGDRPGRAYHWSTGTVHTATGMGGQFVSFDEEKQLIITRIGGPIGQTWSPGEFRNMVYDSLMDGKGSYSLEADLQETAIPQEELDFVNYAQLNGIKLFGEE
jgi:CubicO group peptidase (beta-lactamase class C family)